MMQPSLKLHVEQCRKEHEQWQEEGRARGYSRSISFEEESLVWSIQEYLSCKGEFSEEDIQYLKTLGFIPTDFESTGLFEITTFSPNGEILTSETYFTLSMAQSAYEQYVQEGDIVELAEVDCEGFKLEYGTYQCNFEIEKGKFVKITS